MFRCRNVSTIIHSKWLPCGSHCKFCRDGPNYIQHNASWEANSLSASQEITHIPWFATTSTRAFQLPLSQAGTIQSVPPHPISLRSILLLYSHWHLPLRFLHQNPVCTSLCQMWHIPHPSHSSWFPHSNNNWWGVQIMKLLTLQFPPIPSSSLKPKYLPQHCILRQLQPTLFFPMY